MKIKLFFTLCFLPAFLYAWESNFELSEEAQQRAKFYNQFVQAVKIQLTVFEIVQVFPCLLIPVNTFVQGIKEYKSGKRSFR